MIIDVLGWAAAAWLSCGLLTCVIIMGGKGFYKKPSDWYLGVPVCLALGPFGLWLLWSERN